MKELVMMNFSDVYREEDFYRHEQFRWIDCRDIEGTDCLCDSDSGKEIRNRIKDIPPQGIHFIDSGDYHYISKFFTDKIQDDFDLVVFDHHPDMQPSLFEGVLSCGSWVKAALDTNQHLRKVFLIGTSDTLLQKIDKSYEDRLLEFKESELHDHDTWERFSGLHLTYPIYISIDKDVLSPSVESTNWDQGTATLDELKRFLSILLTNDKLIGIDICGECPYTIQGLLDENLRRDDAVNKNLVEFFRNQLDSINKE